MDHNDNFLKDNAPSLEKIYWKDVREQIAKHDAKLAGFVDNISPGKEFPIYRARYPFGSTIVNEGVFYLPTPDGKLAALNDSRIKQDIRDDLNYFGGKFPAGIVTHNSIELLFEFRDKLCPWRLYKPGTIFAMWAFLGKHPSLHPSRMFNITAGTRAIFMLPNIGDHDYFKKIQREFGVDLDPPKDLLSQWEVFTAITRHPQTKCQWHTELLFFSKNWLTKLNSDDKNWSVLEKYLLQYAWKSSSHIRNSVVYDFAFSMIQTVRNLKPNPYLADTVKHLLAIGANGHSGISGFATPQDEMGAPIAIIQKAFLETYGLKDYPPIIMHQAEFTHEKNSRPVYYSLRFPSAMEFSPHSRKLAITLHDLRELYHLTRVYLEEIRRGRAMIEDTAYGEVANNISYDFFHNQPDSNGWIRLSSEMPNEDPTLMKGFVDYGNLKFPGGSAFCRGCVRIGSRGAVIAP